MRIILFLLMCFAAYNAISSVRATQHRTIIIGDSHAFLIGESAKIPVNVYCTGKGWGRKRLLTALSHEPVQRDVKTCYVSVGTNDGFKADQSDIQALTYALTHTFHAAEIVIIPGSWGWGFVSDKKENDAWNYYDKFRAAGCTVAPCAIGFSRLHPSIHTEGIKQVTNYIKN